MIRKIFYCLLSGARSESLRPLASSSMPIGPFFMAFGMARSLWRTGREKRIGRSLKNSTPPVTYIVRDNLL